MSLRLGRCFEIELSANEMFLKAPLIGQVHASPLGIYWDRPSEIRAAREAFLARIEEEFRTA